MSHPAGGPARSVGIDGKANAACRRQLGAREANEVTGAAV